jgi:hypothetical protein
MQNIKLTNEPNPFCDGTRFYDPVPRHSKPVKMQPWSRNGDKIRYSCPKCFKMEEVHEPPTKRPNTYR